jgi:CheY-specific phosphatase CheX
LDATSIKTLDSVVEGAALALFESVGAPLEKVQAVARSSDDIGASIGFTSSGLRGALVLISTRQLIKRVLPEEVRRNATDEHIADWMGELANQLLGRIKNKLLPLGVALEMSTPTVIFGLDLASKDTRSSQRRSFAFRHGNDALSVFLDAVAAQGFAFSGSETGAGVGIAEGELALF